MPEMTAVPRTLRERDLGCAEARLDEHLGGAAVEPEEHRTQEREEIAHLCLVRAGAVHGERFDRRDLVCA